MSVNRYLDEDLYAEGFYGQDFEDLLESARTADHLPPLEMVDKVIAEKEAPPEPVYAKEPKRRPVAYPRHLFKVCSTDTRGLAPWLSGMSTNMMNKRYW